MPITAAEMAAPPSLTLLAAMEKEKHYAYERPYQALHDHPMV
jgi:hypothetical protein